MQEIKSLPVASIDLNAPAGIIENYIDDHVTLSEQAVETLTSIQEVVKIADLEKHKAYAGIINELLEKFEEEMRLGVDFYQKFCELLLDRFCNLENSQALKPSQLEVLQNVIPGQHLPVKRSRGQRDELEGESGKKSRRVKSSNTAAKNIDAAESIKLLDANFYRKLGAAVTEYRRHIPENGISPNSTTTLAKKEADNKTFIHRLEMQFSDAEKAGFTDLEKYAQHLIANIFAAFKWKGHPVKKTSHGNFTYKISSDKTSMVLTIVKTHALMIAQDNLFATEIFQAEKANKKFSSSNAWGMKQKFFAAPEEDEVKEMVLPIAQCERNQQRVVNAEPAMKSVVPPVRKVSPDESLKNKEKVVKEEVVIEEFRITMTSEPQRLHP